MSKLPVISAKKFEKLLFSIGFEIKRQKEVMFFIGIPMVGTQRFHTTLEETYQEHSFIKSSRR